MALKKGIDVSYAQGNIDFTRIDRDEVQFVLIRSSYGWMSNQKDDMCDRNIKGFQKLGIPCGFYHYSYAESAEDAIKEAEYCIKCIKEYSPELPVFFDIEENSTARLGKRVCTDIVKSFCDYMEKSGYAVGVYTNPNWLENYLYKSELIGKYDLWLAQWGSSKPSYDCEIWQYNVGGKGTVKGISGEIDLNYMYKDYKTSNSASSEKTQTNKTSFKKGDVIKVINPINYDNGQKFIVYDNAVYTVIEAVRDRIVIGINGHVTSAVAADNIRKITTASSSGSASETKTYTYIVKDGDTLSGIAAKYNTTYQKIAKDNSIENPDLIFAGQKLKINL